MSDGKSSLGPLPMDKCTKLTLAVKNPKPNDVFSISITDKSPSGKHGNVALAPYETNCVKGEFEIDGNINEVAGDIQFASVTMDRNDITLTFPSTFSGAQGATVEIAFSLYIWAASAVEDVGLRTTAPHSVSVLATCCNKTEMKISSSYNTIPWK